jgi:hypothetical protein
VGLVEGAGGLQTHQQRLARREPPAEVEHATQAAAGQVLGDQVRRALVLAPVVDGDDVRVVERGCGLRLGPEAAEEALVVGEGGVEELDRHPAAKPGVVGQQDLGRCTGADRRDEAVAAAEHATDEVVHAGHSHGPRVGARCRPAGDGRADFRSMRVAVAEEIEAFISSGALWDAGAVATIVAWLAAESESTGDPLPGRLGRFLDAVRLRQLVSDVSAPKRAEIEAIVYPRLWKVIEAIRSGLPDGEVRTRVDVMNRRLARLFVEETIV